MKRYMEEEAAPTELVRHCEKRALVTKICKTLLYTGKQLQNSELFRDTVVKDLSTDELKTIVGIIANKEFGARS